MLHAYWKSKYTQGFRKKDLKQINCFEVLCIMQNLKEMEW